MVTSRISVLAGQGLSPAIKLKRWVGPGKPVTANGVLKPSQLPGAAAALGVEVPAKVRTAADVPRIHWPWIAAQAAGLIEVGAAKAVAREADGDPAQLWLTGLDAVLAAESHDPDRRGARTLCRAVLTAAADECPPETAAEIVEEYEDAATAHKAFRQTGELPVAEAVALLRSFGALDGKKRLTPLGRWAHERYEARAPESVTSDLPPAELLARLAPLTEDEAWRLALRWFGDRRPVFGAAQLLDAAEFCAPVARVAAVDVAAGFGAEALPALRNCLRHRNLRAHAMAALASWGEGRGVDEAQRRWLVTEYALAARARRDLEDAFHYVRDSGGLSVLADSAHPDAAALHRALTAAEFRVRVQQLKIARTDQEWWRVLVPAGTTLSALHESSGSSPACAATSCTCSKWTVPATPIPATGWPSTGTSTSYDCPKCSRGPATA
ncbi:hypothetical protein LWP59_07060 [Amycolatopsis acidiphila]|uniref:hypothetical protein n=1 Tax=Amycolatopsis acidiphila TaxID=715473 RepID=UPI001643E093|nr:hypothetical protein [Amycolatopsis acidiphila]UIJ61382.1 hypothetical protein LWP59_07060 [Amycolatopsis acidiphila]GHG77941.1 hypothetical protein GCM10017788_44540 [Amycolatopsis acidiphila]